MDKEKDRLAQAYTDRETETAQFILIDTNIVINLGEDGDRRLFGGRLKESLEKNDREIRFCLRVSHGLPHCFEGRPVKRCQQPVLVVPCVFLFHKDLLVVRPVVELPSSYHRTAEKVNRSQCD